VGLPPTSGLIGKLEVVTAALGAGGAWGIVTVVVVLVSSLIGLVAMLRLWRGTMWGGPARGAADAGGDSAGGDSAGGDSDERQRRDDENDGEARPSPRVPARLLVPGGALAAVSVAMFLGYGAIAPEVDRAVAGLVDTDA